MDFYLTTAYLISRKYIITPAYRGIYILVKVGITIILRVIKVKVEYIHSIDDYMVGETLVICMRVSLH